MKDEFKNVIKGKVVSLRPLKKEDCRKVCSWVNSPYIRETVDIKEKVSLEEEYEWFDKAERDVTKLVFAIDVEKDHIGNISLRNVSRVEKEGELTIFIGEESMQGKGYGYDALISFLGFCFDSMDLQRVYLKVFNYNKRAISLYRKAGFKKIGYEVDKIVMEKKKDAN